MRIFTLWTLALWTAGCLAQAADTSLMSEPLMRQGLDRLRIEQSDAAKLQQARQLFIPHHLSSLQVKSIAMTFGDDSARMDFALAAYPRVVDPENFYEVYDAFRTFSKVMRLHDQIHLQRAPGGMSFPEPPVRVVAQRDLDEILAAIRNASFDKDKLRLARQIIGAKKAFLSRQIKEILRLFDYEDGRLEAAKFAYDYVVDPQNYFVVYDTFSFDSQKEQLAQYIEKKQRSPQTVTPEQPER